MLSKEWIGGFISGEGCFTFNGTTPHFSICLSIKDIHILYELKEIIGLGRITTNKVGFSNSYLITKIEDCLKLIEFIDGTIFGDKKIDYDNWKFGINFLTSFDGNSSKEDRKFLHILKPRQNKERKVFTEDDIPEHIMIIKNCERCKENFNSKVGYRQYCEKCVLSGGNATKENKKIYMREYMRKFTKKNPNYFRDSQRKRLNIPEYKWISE